MTAHLRDARRALEVATDSADDEEIRASIDETASAFAEFERGDRQPDHAVLDGHLNELRQVRERADGETAEQVGEALEYAEAYRETISRT